jgi:alcohol dehydrogenase (NADP+)
MKTLRFKNNDTMPILGLGTWKSKPNEVYLAVKTALKLGYRHIDCAAIYGNEKEVGLALTEAMHEGLVMREDLWITSKLWNNAHKKEHVAQALKNTLGDLGLDYLDLYLIHWPIALKASVLYPSKGGDFLSLDEMPILETWEAMTSCLETGLTRHIGVSNFSMKKLETLINDAEYKPEMNQIELHLFLQQSDMLNFCKTNDVYLTAYAPLGSGDRPPALKSENEPKLMQNRLVREIADSHNCSPAQVLIRWAIERGTAVIPKSVNPGRLAENLKSLAVSLSGDDMTALSSLDKQFRYIRGNLWTIPGSPYHLDNLWDE